MSRSCNGCTKCCEGWLSADIYGHVMDKNKPCHFLGCGGCSIYNNRPEDPCKNYSCSWILEPNTFPYWLKPDVENILITRRISNEHVFYEFLECGSNIKIGVLHWIVQWALTNNVNVVYQLNGAYHKVGSIEFMNASL